MKPLYITILIFSLALLSGCGGNPSNSGNGSASASSSNSNSSKTNIEELTMSVNVPYQVNENDLVWKEFPEQKRIIAVMRLDPSDAAKAVSEATGFGTPETISLPSQKWFPDELVAQAETSGDNTLHGQSYPANAFFQPPYTSGHITRIEGTDYFVLDITAK